MNQNKQTEHDPYLSRAIELAEQYSANGDHGPFGAVIVKNEKIIAEGWNQVAASNDPTAHAEIVAIRLACQRLGTFQLKGCTIYSSCEPCPMCLAAIYWAGIKVVIFAADKMDAAAAGFADAFLYKEFDKPWQGRRITFDQALQKEGRQVFEKWRQNPHKIIY